ncbi:MAG: GNAT family N-acetyltransferase [Syntrophorhabdaceae bacterium]|nr:GNAT family N-acetyltransferase [Syntrophorhabdaceae bacterium]
MKKLSHTTKIRDAHLDDMDIIIELFGDLNYEIHNTDGFRRLFEIMVEERNTWGLFVADNLEKQEPVGFVSVNIRPCLRLEGLMASIEELVVKKEFRGMGIGSMLLEKAISFANEHYCKRIEVLSSTWRESYKREFYIKNGFIEHSSAVFRINKE